MGYGEAVFTGRDIVSSKNLGSTYASQLGLVASMVIQFLICFWNSDVYREFTERVMGIFPGHAKRALDMKDRSQVISTFLNRKASLFLQRLITFHSAAVPLHPPIRILLEIWGCGVWGVPRATASVHPNLYCSSINSKSFDLGN